MKTIEGMLEHLEGIANNMWINQPYVVAQCEIWRKEREYEEALSELMRPQAPARKV